MEARISSLALRNGKKKKKVSTTVFVVFTTFKRLIFINTAVYTASNQKIEIICGNVTTSNLYTMKIFQ